MINDLKKKGDNMNDQISKKMAEVNAQPLPEEMDPNRTFVQTEADVGKETPETRVN
jgi:hypothetical protein